MTEKPPSGKKPGLFPNLVFNLLIPIVLLSKGTEWLGVSPALNLALALAFPLCYGIHEAITRKRFNIFSALGFVSILAKGGIGLLNLPKEYVAYNEAALPLIFAVAVLVTLPTRKPLIKLFLYSEEVFDVAKIEAALLARGTKGQFDKLLAKCTWLLAASFLLSAVLNFAVAKIFIKTDPAENLERFNQEMGAMQGWSYVIITIPTMAVTVWALMLLIKGLESLTGYKMQEVLADEEMKSRAQIEAAN